MKIKLGCHICGRPWGYIYNGTLIVESRHGGETHSNVLSLQLLGQLLSGQPVKIALMESIAELEEMDWDDKVPAPPLEQARTKPTPRVATEGELAKRATRKKA